MLSVLRRFYHWLFNEKLSCECQFHGDSDLDSLPPTDERVHIRRIEYIPIDERIHILWPENYPVDAVLDVMPIIVYENGKERFKIPGSSKKNIKTQ